MGSLQAQEMAELLDTETAIAWHLQSNHYPPVPLSMVEPCLEAIEAYMVGDYFRSIELPHPVKYRGHGSAPADVIIEQHHLWAWVELDEEGLEG